MLDVRWTWLFLDVPVDDRETAVRFWTAVTNTSTSPWRGADDEFTTLQPEDEPAWLKLQVVGGPGGVHLDLDVDDPATAAEAAERLGATVLARPDHVVLASPGGFPFCLTRVAEPAPRWRSRVVASRADQACLDVPVDGWETEATFWSDLLGWERRTSRVREEFDWLVRPDGLPVRVLLQRLEEPSGPVRGHVDIASADRDMEVARHVDLGATVVATESHWTVLDDPTGRRYCVTDRDPVTGLLETP